MFRLESELMLPEETLFILGDKLANNEFSLCCGPGELADKFRDGFEPLKFELLPKEAVNEAKPLDESFVQSKHFEL